MFTGIIEQLGVVKSINKEGENIHFTLEADFTNELKVDQSVAHNGCCLTVVNIDQKEYTVTAIQETLHKTNLDSWKVGSKVNLERCMIMNGRLDGHIVQGHVDTTAVCISKDNPDGSWKFTFEYNSNDVTVEKGSVTINGTSLTVVDSKMNFHQIDVGSTVNLEFDIIGKYVAKMMVK